MKKVIYSTFCAVGAIALATSCSDFLETSSPSKTDAAFVFSTSETARAALEGAYAAWVDAAQNKVFGDEVKLENGVGTVELGGTKKLNFINPSDH